MATLPIKPLDGADGYLRWKESVLLRLHSVGVAHVLSDDPPAETSAATNKWARDDAVCRGHILHALSDRVFPDYVRHGTGRAVWQAVARVYDVDSISDFYPRRYVHDFRFVDGTSFLEQLAHAEALVATRDPPPTDAEMARKICGKLPALMAALIWSDDGNMSMARIWESALKREEMRILDADEAEREAETASVEQRKTGHRHRHR